MQIEPQIETTDDGSQTLRHPILGETYHSNRGAMGESQHVFIDNGLKFCELQTVRILEVGFGSGLNGWLTMREAEVCGRQVEYWAVERYPVEIGVARQMQYAEDKMFMRLHEAQWGELQEIEPWFRIKKIEGDLVDTKFDATFDLIYFDAFAPDSQPELWTAEVFRGMYNVLSDSGILVTYSAKGVVKRALREAGFEVSRLAGALGKFHMLRALKEKNG